MNVVNRSLLLFFTVLWAIAPLRAAVEVESPPDTDTLENPDERWGIQVLEIRRSASDYILDLRFRLLDAEKASSVMNRKNHPRLIVEATGAQLHVPVSQKLGALRQAPRFAKAGRNYFVLFANPGRTVKAGDKVTVEIGDFKQEHIIVE